MFAQYENNIIVKIILFNLPVFVHVLRMQESIKWCIKQLLLVLLQLNQKMHFDVSFYQTACVCCRCMYIVCLVKLATKSKIQCAIAHSRRKSVFNTRFD